MNTDLSTLTEAKKIYTSQLCKLLQPQIYKGLLAIWSLCKDSDEPLKNFQRKLEIIPRWNSMIIDDEYRRIVEDTKCDYIDKLLDATFIANAKILSVLNRSSNNLDISVPGPKKFLHSCYISCAYNFFSNPYVFDDRERGHDYRKQQKNMKEIVNTISLSISDTIENLLPIEDLLKSCLSQKEQEYTQPLEYMPNKIIDSDSGSDSSSGSETRKDIYSSIDVTTNDESGNVEELGVEPPFNSLHSMTLEDEPVHPKLDIIEGVNVFDANKKHILVNTEPIEPTESEESTNNENIMLSNKQMDELDKDVDINISDSESDTSEDNLHIPIKSDKVQNGDRVTFFNDI